MHLPMRMPMPAPAPTPAPPPAPPHPPAPTPTPMPLLVLVQVDGAPSPEPTGLMRFRPDEYREVRPTSKRRRWFLALVPLADMLLELGVWSAGCLFLVMSEVRVVRPYSSRQ